MWLKKKLRRLFGRCPYCSAKLSNGLGGSTLLSLNGVKMCPNHHYAEELHFVGAIIIHDNGGKPLNVRD